MKPSATIAALAMVGACTGAVAVPAVYKGHVANVALEVPSRIATSVLYEGESDWTPRDRSPSERTTKDRIVEIEFFIDLDHPDVIQIAEDAGARRSSWDSTLHHPAVFGHVIGVTALLEPDRGGDLTYFQRDVIDKRFGGLNLRPRNPVYGLSYRSADIGTASDKQKKRWHELSTTTEDFLSQDHYTYISCNSAEAAVPPFESMPTCDVHVSDPAMHATMLATIDRGDLPQWRSLRQAMTGTLESFASHATLGSAGAPPRPASPAPRRGLDRQGPPSR